ncbi:pyridoxal phosphate-dependent aminotransferase [Rhodococcus sp. T2V]|uniref:pyridoxal phosphate-dependent aminotransferase n=1 Tax=Rhodococcus sp. T2V TaxID=3034164 RepID=UPI0023E1F32C|nr:pyridoxal phosphate-dependent aminotransferase [Rhodococcus sp. T2V]MDF3310871.1 pyridoxal phosphate-dependent aminotransferase [Rhodococcus sp. T2V]
MLERLPALALSERAQVRRRAGQAMVPMRGVPMLPMPPHVVDVVSRAAPDVFPRDSRGSITLKTAIAEHLQEKFDLVVNPERELLVTHGAQHGLSVALRALLVPGDEILIPAPSYFFDGTVRLAGAVPRYVPSAESDGWRLPLDQLEAAISPRVRAILLCNPNNPTGTVPTREELTVVLELARRHNLYVFADESYERYVHEGPGYVPQMSLADGYDRLVTLTSLSKNYAFTSWRVGYIHAKADLIDIIHAALEWDAINIGDIPQLAAAAAISGPQEWLDREFCTFRARRDLLLEGVAAAGLTVATPQAGIFAFVNFSPVGVVGIDLEERLLDVGITALSGDRFFGPGSCARVLYGGTEPSLAQLGRQLKVLAHGTSA